MRLQYLWCIGLQGDLVHSLHGFFYDVEKQLYNRKKVE